MIMSQQNRFDNRVKSLRQARGWTQQELAEATGLSRTGVSAIEASRLVPSVAAAMDLAQALGCTVEALFGRAAAAMPAAFVSLPATFPCRYWAAEVAGHTCLYPVESSARGDLPHDGVAQNEADLPNGSGIAAKTLVLASCDPAAGLLASLYERRSGLRMVVLMRTSSEALALVDQGRAHVAGVHFTAAASQRGNGGELRSRKVQSDLHLVHLAQWQEGLAIQSGTSLRTAAAAARAHLRWVGRQPGAGARRCQDLLLGERNPPRRVAHDHRGVVEAIRGGWADVGVCHRLASEEAGLKFLPIEEENYDLCFRSDMADDARLACLLETVRSSDYRRLLAELPGYRPQPDFGEIEHVAAG
jgi:molybdate-binding protein/transcriptional regulator with XRE-family HTH domain